VQLPEPRSSKIKKTLVFDLDETLVHCIDEIEDETGDKLAKCDQIISVTFPNGETVKAGLNIRPFAYECLEKASKNY